MNTQYILTFAADIGFPVEAIAELERTARCIEEKSLTQEFYALGELFRATDYKTSETETRLIPFSEEIGVSHYTVWLLLLLSMSEGARALFRSDAEFRQTFEDLRYKLYECREVKGVWGNFVSFWYVHFFKGRIVKLGRLQYESTVYPYDTPYENHGVTIRKGDPVKSIHIPSHCGPFDKETRLDSYRRAYEYFADERAGGPLVCFCHSWLLYPAYKNILPEESNILSFTREFDILHESTTEHFSDAWRVFGAEHDKKNCDLPEETSLQRAFKKHLINGGAVGNAAAILLFDGEKILTLH